MFFKYHTLARLRRFFTFFKYVGLVFISFRMRSHAAAFDYATLSGDDILLSASGAFVVLAAADRWWLRPRTRHGEVVIASMKALYAGLFGNTRGHRITFVAPRRRGSKYIRPCFRYEYGEGTHLRSKAKFRKHEGLAGVAWKTAGDHEDPAGVPVMTFDSFRDERAWLDFQRDTCKIETKRAAKLSARTRELAWLACCGVVGELSKETVGVLCIDSTKASSLDKLDFDLVMYTASILSAALESPAGE